MDLAKIKPCRWLAIMLAVGACLGLFTWTTWPRSSPAPAWAADYDVTTRPPESIAPGTRVGRTPPDGWSHLVIKSLPRVRPGEESNLPFLGRTRTIRMASWMFTAFVADVRAESQGTEVAHRIRAIALGLGTAIGDGDVIITPETAATYGEQLDWITREILTKGYATQQLAMVVVHGPVMALVDTPVWFRNEGKHRLLRFRYALLVEPASGRLDVLVWLLDAVGGSGDGSVIILTPNTIDEAELIPDPGEFNALGIPSDAAFAVDRLPRGRARWLLPEDLRSLAAKSKYTRAEAGVLESRLRQLIASDR